jgi:hypothetical protein
MKIVRIRLLQLNLLVTHTSLGQRWVFFFRLIFSILVFACCQTYIGLVFEMQLTDFKKLLNDEFMKFKGNKSSAQQNHPLLRQFREAVWVHFLTLIDFDFFLALLHFTKASHDYFLAVT